MAGGIAPRLGENGEARPGAGIGAGSGEEGGEQFARLGGPACVRPSACAPIKAAAAWPSAQALTSWPSAAIRPSASRSSATSTRLPQTGECFSAKACAPSSRPRCGIPAASLNMSRE